MYVIITKLEDIDMYSYNFLADFEYFTVFVVQMFWIPTCEECVLKSLLLQSFSNTSHPHLCLNNGS